MSNPQYPAFTLTGKASLICGATSANVALPTTGTPTAARISNVSQYPAWVLLGTSNAVSVTSATGVVIQPNSQLWLVMASNTYLAGIGQGAILDIALGI